MRVADTLRVVDIGSNPWHGSERIYRSLESVIASRIRRGTGVSGGLIGSVGRTRVRHSTILTSYVGDGRHRGRSEFLLHLKIPLVRVAVFVFGLVSIVVSRGLRVVCGRWCGESDR